MTGVTLHTTPSAQRPAATDSAPQEVPLHLWGYNPLPPEYRALSGGGTQHAVPSTTLMGGGSHADYTLLTKVRSDEKRRWLFEETDPESNIN